MEPYLYHLYSVNATYGATPNFIVRTALPGSGYTSLYSVTKDTAEAIKQAGTTTSFKGVVWSERLWIDVDSYEEADRVEEGLRELNVDFIAYDSGGRGAHFGILRITEPSHLLPQQDKAWVEKWFPEADRSIYTHLHPFRLPGTIHEKTGRRKAVVCDVRGSAITLPPFKREAVQVSTPSSSEGRRKSIFNYIRVMREMKPSSNGERHYSLVRLVYALRDDVKASRAEATYWCEEWNRLLSDPKSPEELAKVIGSIYG